MNSSTAAFLLCGLIWHLALSQAQDKKTLHVKVHPDLNCSFDDSFCSWKFDSTSSKKLEWTRSRGKEAEYWHRTGPLSDHTTGSGHFLLMDVRYPYEMGIACMESAPVVTNNETCLSFWYYMYGYAIGSLNVYRIGREETNVTLFSKSGLQGKRWYRTMMDSGTGIFKLQIEGTYGGENDHGDIAIDDVTFSYQRCLQEELSQVKDQPKVDCNFESDFCSWFFRQQTSMSWQLKKVSPDSKDRTALPPGSKGTSYVEMVKSESGYDRKAKLRGPSISVNSTEACLSFWYRVDGQGIEEFHVNKHYNGKSPYSSGLSLFSTNVEASPEWVQGLVTIPEGQNFFLAFFVLVKSRVYGKFGLDDIRLTHGGPCIKAPESLINCDFEKDFCRWYLKTRKDQGDWIRTRDPTPTNSTGPSTDHTSGDGYYIFLDASAVEEANLYSSKFSVNSSGACLSFWYYMHGPDVYTLQLRSGGNRYYIPDINDWSLKGPQGNRWIRQNISIGAGFNMHLVFTAKRRYFPRGDIALDDISITFGAKCESSFIKETTDAASYSNAEMSTTDSWEDTSIPTSPTSTSTTEAPFIETPQLLVIGDINPAYNASRIELNCQHADESGGRVRWLKRDREYLDKQIIPGEGGRSLLFEEIQSTDAGFYSCYLQGHPFYGYSSNDSNEVEIKVVPDTRPSPLLNADYNYGDAQYGNHYDVLVDGVVKLICGVEIDNVNYLWKTSSNAFNSLSLPNDRILVLNGTKPEHSGIYSCRLSKDEFKTARSNELNLRVRKGRRCQRSWSCPGGVDYNGECVDQRCQCSRNAVLHRRGCKRRPEKPRVTTSPSFLEFGVGESFYVLCEAGEPAPTKLTYTFQTDSEILNMGSLNIMKISNATERDSSSYRCHVTADGIDSLESEGVYIQIKDFIDLNCDFDNNLCTWFQDQESDTANFALVSHASDDILDNNDRPSGSFLQLYASNTTVPSQAILLSPTIERMALDSCLTFWYRLHGPEVYSLSVWRFKSHSEYSGDFEGSKLWSAIGEKGNLWFKQTVTVGKGTQLYIVFDAIGTVAIDNITFTYRGGC